MHQNHDACAVGTWRYYVRLGYFNVNWEKSSWPKVSNLHLHIPRHCRLHRKNMHEF